MTTSDTPKQLPLSDAMRIFASYQSSLKRPPSLDDIFILLRRLNASEQMLAEANTSLALQQHTAINTRIIYILLATLSDDTIQDYIGPLPELSIPALMSAIERLSSRFISNDELSDPLNHEALLRQVAAQLNIHIEDERPDTSSYLLKEQDHVLQQLNQRREEFQQALIRAKQAIDTKHRPARPYGE